MKRAEKSELIKVGYGRVATVEKQKNSLENQREKLQNFGCEIIFLKKRVVEKMTGKSLIGVSGSVKSYLKTIKWYLLL